MLACVIFGALAGVFAAVFALAQGRAFADAFALYLGVSLAIMVGLPLLCALVRRLLRFARQGRVDLVALWTGG